MKWLLSLALVTAGLFAAPAKAQMPNKISMSQLEAYMGFVRRSPCAIGNADHCGSDPPTFQVTPAMCGTVFSTSAARNEDGSVSKKGVRFVLPNLSGPNGLLAAGRSPAGATGDAAIRGLGREAQCEIHFVMGLPGPANYLRIAIDGVFGKDRVTFIRAGAFHDSFNGDVVFPYMSPGVLTVAWNGVSWLPKAATPSLAEQLHLGQLQSHGRGRLFLVTKDPTWWTAGTRVGSLAYCPHNGLGTVTNANGGPQLAILPIDCLFHAPGVGTATEYITMRMLGLTVTGMSAGAAYSAGTAPSGETYVAGNYIRISVSTTLNFQSGDVVDLYNLKPQLGTRIMGRWIGKLIDANTIELHEEVSPYSDTAKSHVGPPSSFVSGDSLGTIATGAHGYYLALVNTSLDLGRRTGAASGVEFEAENGIRAIVGAAYHNLGQYVANAKNAPVASLFNPTETLCRSTTASDRTITSTTFVEVNSDMRCFFVYINRSSSQSISLGDVGDEARWQMSVGAANNTANNGCEFSVGFNGATAEATIAGFVNPSGISGGRQTVAASGLKRLPADGRHFVTLLARAVTGGTCTIFAGSTTLNLFLMQ